MKESMFRFSIIIPVKPDGTVRALSHLAALAYPAEQFEIIVAEGSRPSRQRNRAAEQATGDILFFLDDDSQLQPDALTRLSLHFADPAVAAAGGPSLTPATDSLLQQGFGAAFSSLMGGGAVRNRYRQAGGVRYTDDRELILCNLAIRRELFLALGGLDERLYPNEENELMERIARGGGKLVHDPQLPVFRSQRPTWRAFVRQLLTYGRGRGEQTRISGFGGIATVVPSIFVVYLLAGLFVRNPVYHLPLLCYLFLAGGSALYEGIIRRRPALVPLLLCIFPVIHLCYGYGTLLGLALPRFKKGVSSDANIHVRTVKQFADIYQSTEV